MSENKRDYEVGRGKPPAHSRFMKGQSGNPRGPRPKNLPALLVAAMSKGDPTVFGRPCRFPAKPTIVAECGVQVSDRTRCSRCGGEG